MPNLTTEAGIQGSKFEGPPSSLWIPSSVAFRFVLLKNTYPRGTSTRTRILAFAIFRFVLLKKHPRGASTRSRISAFWEKTSSRSFYEEQDFGILGFRCGRKETQHGIFALPPYPHPAGGMTHVVSPESGAPR